jgi:hypothetical protein
MTHKEIEKYRAKLVQIQNSNLSIDECLEKLWALARQVGASQYRKVPWKDSDVEGATDDARRESILSLKKATIAEIVFNIDNTLRTASIIRTCEISTRTFWIAVISAAVALLAMLAAWAAVLVNFVGCGG